MSAFHVLQATLKEQGRPPGPPIGEVIKHGWFSELPSAEAPRVLMKAVLPVPDDGEHNAESNRTVQGISQSDLSGDSWMLRRHLSHCITDGRCVGVAAAKAEGRINNFADAVAMITNANTSTSTRVALLNRAVSILRGLATESGMDALDVAPIEGQLHTPGQTLGMGSPTDLEDPLVA